MKSHFSSSSSTSHAAWKSRPLLRNASTSGSWYSYGAAMSVAGELAEGGVLFCSAWPCLGVRSSFDPVIMLCNILCVMLFHTEQAHTIPCVARSDEEHLHGNVVAKINGDLVS